MTFRWPSRTLRIAQKIVKNKSEFVYMHSVKGDSSALEAALP